MHSYEKPRKYDRHADKPCPFLPPVRGDVIPTDRIVSIVYGRDGLYIGWCELAEMHKYLYAGLYYKTKGAYKVCTNKRYENRNRKLARRNGGNVDIKDITVFERTTCNTALYIVQRPVNEYDFVATNNKVAMAESTIAAIGVFGLTGDNVNKLPDPFKLYPNKSAEIFKAFVEFKRKQAKELHEYLDFVRASAAAHVQAIADGERLLIKTSQEQGIKLDI